MSMIFPGMDPYLEEPQIWEGVHTPLIVSVTDHLRSLLRHRYVAQIQSRFYSEGDRRHIIPDVAVRHNRPALVSAAAVAEAPVIVRVPLLQVRESYVAIVDPRSKRRVVTVIEVLSPTKIRWLAPPKYADSNASPLTVTIDGPTSDLEIPLSWEGGQPFVEETVTQGDASGLPGAEPQP